MKKIVVCVPVPNFLARIEFLEFTRKARIPALRCLDWPDRKPCRWTSSSKDLRVVRKLWNDGHTQCTGFDNFLVRIKDLGLVKPFLTKKFQQFVEQLETLGQVP